MTLKFILLEPSAFLRSGSSGRSRCIESYASQHLVMVPLAGLEADSHVPLVFVGRIQLPRHTKPTPLGYLRFLHKTAERAHDHWMTHSLPGTIPGGQMEYLQHLKEH